MRVVAQKVSRASVRVGGEVVGEIGRGLMLLISAGADDADSDAAWMARKIVNLRVFPDDDGKMNLSLLDVGGEILAISQFTLHGDCRKGNRPSFVKAMPPDEAGKYFESFVDLLKENSPRKVATGIFGAMMDVELVNDGPVTLLLDSKKTF